MNDNSFHKIIEILTINIIRTQQKDHNTINLLVKVKSLVKNLLSL